ncbi:carbohydrate binding family 9 domain-containing protein [Hymenobacter weizhouensis]|uniref:carbohydrate binding family 9 domain-containing protein n=1 Tax=Hymenobacter sp. YIM 151500-1 TaxID=2987689 RepID=UPI0022276703|nr:carbohydrate binding family 9 domain-containing protein [Hymenobacter sp. YIM 151500-1]UYZ63221.1 carbohydrate binding family 9 domain-containing protein [Hymenobacter sp. YIM 151500-1]
MRTVLCMMGWLWLAGAGLAHGQTAPAAAKPAAPTLAPKRQLQAVRTATAPKIDGQLDEAVWQTAPVADHFIEQQPTPGRPEKHPTEVRVLYDDENLYIGARMQDVSQDSILRELSQRDDIGNSDWFGVFLDTYHDRLNGYGFIVTPGGVQVDSRYSPAAGEDGAWNAVWESRTQVNEREWVAELRIPYSAIRFAKAPEQLWGVNFGRQRRSTRQSFWWNEVKPEVDGFVNQWGELQGLQNLVPPLRLSLTPYVGYYLNHYPYNQPDQRNTSTSITGGADVKWGINESFTLDATLVPDFGQVISDNQVLNLSPFEVQFQENRQFFTEGTELFNKGNIFYSRRVGATPIGFYGVQGQLNPGEEVVKNPSVTRLINATKISGRTSKGLGVGIFNAISNNEYATVRHEGTREERDILTQPLTNYNIVVLDQSLKNNSFASLINTNVTRQGTTYDANVTGGLLRLANKKNTHALDVRGFYSRRRGQLFNSERRVDDQDGYKYYVNYGKISGKFTWNVDHGIESHTYNPNDLGLLFANNSIEQSVNFGYNIYSPFWKVNRLNTYWGASYQLLEKPTRYQEAFLYWGGSTTFTKNFLSTWINFDLAPTTRDFFDPRVEPIGRYFVRQPGNFGINGGMSSDYRKKLAYDVYYGTRFFGPDSRVVGGDVRRGRRNLALTVAPRYRVNNHLNFRYEASYQLNLNQIGYAGGLDSMSYPLDRPFMKNFNGDVLLGRRRVSTVTNTLNAGYTFTNNLSFTIRARHYMSHVRYRDFSRLRPNGEEEATDYQRNRNTTFNAFNVDAFLTWWFAPGSQVSVVWKNSTASFLQAEEALPQYFSNFNNTINTPHNNSVSVRVLYFLDYLMLKPKRKL